MSGVVGVIPLARVLETLRHSALRSAVSGEPDEQALAEVRRSGLLGTAVPEQYGGGGGDAAAVNEVVEWVAAVNPSMAIILFQHFAVTARLCEWGTAAQKEELLPALATGECLAASAWSEPGAGAAKKKLTTRASRLPDGGWLLDGAKSFTTGAGVADLYLVLVATSTEQEDDDGSAYGSAGQTFFLVRGDNPGLVPHLDTELVGMRGSATGLLWLHECVVRDEDRLGPLGHAPTIIAGVRESGATLGAVSVGIAQAALDIAAEHAGRTGKLGTQAVRHRLADLSVQVEAARAIVASAGRKWLPEPGAVTLRSKLFASSTAEHVCLEVARLLGSATYQAHHQVNRLLADARAVGLMGPANDLCRELVAAAWT